MNTHIPENIKSISKEFEQLTRQQCYFLPEKDFLSNEFEIDENYPNFCQEIIKSETGIYLCKRKHLTMINCAITQKEPEISVCHAGLYIIIVPIISQTEPIGVFQIFFASQSLLPNTIKQKDFYKQKYHCDENALIKSITQIPTVNTQILRAVGNLLFSLVQIQLQPDTPANGDIPDFDVEDQFDVNNLSFNPFSQNSLSNLIHLNKDDKYYYQTSDNVLEKCFNRIFVDIRVGQLVRAKENFKSIFTAVYLEEDLEKEKYAAIFLILKFNDNLLRRISYYQEVYDITLPILHKISRAQAPSDIRHHINDYFDSITQIYQIKKKNRIVLVSKIVQYIEENYGRPFKIKDMAEEMNVSTSHASRTFKEQMGISIKTYVNEIRMYNAQHFLRYTNWSVNLIAERVGYSNVRSFYKMFEKHFNIPCTKLRQSFNTKTIKAGNDENTES
ncbi:MAG TPA: hypothetical protein DCK95_08520 [Anaerolineaceae bacterium]|nr:hypothetical protein [Anaerolineaceae bacterium]